MFRWGIAFKGCMMCHRCRMMKWSHANLEGGVDDWVGNCMVYRLGMVYRLHRVYLMFTNKMV